MAAGARTDHEPEDEFRSQLVRTIPSLRAFARGLCGDRDLADDLAQEAMVRAWAARESFAPGTNFRAWMFKIVRNQFYTTLRKNVRIVDWDQDAADRILVSKPTQEARLEMENVQRALVQLPPQQREMLLLVAAAGLSYEEAAAVTGCPLGTVKSRIARSRRALIQLLEDGDLFDETGEGE